MTTSRQDVAEDALLVLMQADPTLGAVEGGPEFGVPASPAKEHVWIHEMTELDQETDLTGGTRPEMLETFEIRVGVFVSRSGDDTEAARNRTTELVSALENVIRANPHFGLTPADVYYAQITHIARSVGAWPDNVGVMKLVTVGVDAYLPGLP